MESDRFNYRFTEPTKSGDIEQTYSQRYTVDKALNSARVAQFIVEGHEDSCIDLTKCYIKTRFRILAEDGSPITEGAPVFACPHYSSNLWSSVSITLNNTPIPPGNDYPYTALLTDLLGASPEVRDGVLTSLAGWSSPTHSTSKVNDALTLNPIVFDDYKAVGANSKEITVYHRIHSDFLQTCSQLLPNRMQLGITLTRAKDSFVLAREGSDTNEYKVDISSVSLFIRRITPNSSTRAAINTKLSSGGRLHYQRLHLIAFPCALGSLTWSWHNIYNGTAPRRVFVAMVSQESYFGNYNRISTYLESSAVRNVRFCLDGREILPEPYTTKWEYTAPGVVDWENSDAKSPFAGLNQVINVFSAPRQHVGIRYNDYINGATVYAVSLEHAEGLATVPGSLDCHIEFAKPLDEPMIILLLAEYPKSISFDAARNITEL